MLEAQREHFASDDHVREEVRMWADTTPEQRLRELDAMSADNEVILARMNDATLARLHRLRELPADALAILENIRKASR